MSDRPRVPGATPRRRTLGARAEKPRPGAASRPAVPRKIVSGGQTGADRAALDWAMDRGVRHGGWCPRGRRAEDGAIPRRYRLTETPTDRYEERTEWNVRDSDGTVIFSLSETLGGGSLLTARIASALGKPCLHLSASADAPAARLRRFVQERRLQVLNVAGPRASGEPGVGCFVRRTLEAAFGTPRASR